MGSTERFIALLAAVLSCLAIAGAALRYLVRISYQTGQLVQRFDGHLQDEREALAELARRVGVLERGRHRR